MLVQRLWLNESWISTGVARLPGYPLAAQSLQLFTRPNTLPVLSGSDNAQQQLIDDFSGVVDLSAGVVQFTASNWFKAENLLINGVADVIVPTDADILGLDTTRLPMTGRVPIIKRGNLLLIHSTKQDALTTPQAGATAQLSRTDLAWARVKDANGIATPTAGYSVNLVTGILTWSNPLDLGATTPPYVCEHRIQDLVTVTEATLNGRVRFNLPMRHAYAAADSGAAVSTVLPVGILQGRIQTVGSYQSWSGVFTTLGATEQTLYDNVSYPIITRNDWSVEDEWVIVFTTSQQFKAIGRQRGQLTETGMVANDYSPTNPLTNLPFFTIQAEGWRSGIIPGNFIHFYVRSASAPVWIMRATMPNVDVPIDDSITIELIGDVMP
jgi:hypothetical protein